MAGLSISQFERRFRDACGTSPRKYVLRVRVDAAARMLIGTGLTVSEIAQECGFHDHAHLSRSFRKILVNPQPNTARTIVWQGRPKPAEQEPNLPFRQKNVGKGMRAKDSSQILLPSFFFPNP